MLQDHQITCGLEQANIICGTFPNHEHSKVQSPLTWLTKTHVWRNNYVISIWTRRRRRNWPTPTTANFVPCKHRIPYRTQLYRSWMRRTRQLLPPAVVIDAYVCLVRWVAS